MAAAIAVVAGTWLLWGSRQAGMRAEAEARRAVPPESVVFGPVEGGVSSAEAPKPTAKPDAQDPLMSPFRRSHPWAAYPQGRFYYPSSCAETLEFDDLVYFATEKEARAAGFLPSRSSRCP